MKLSIGENIRNYRKKNDITQDALAERLGVSYQSISRGETGTTYPDLELIPAIAEILKITVDELFGMSQIEKEKRASQTFDELRRECMKKNYDADKIVNMIRDIRINYLNSNSAWRPWVEGNDRAFRDKKILPEVRLLAEAYLERNPMYPHTLDTLARIEDEEHIEEFLKKYTTSFDCSARALLFDRYLRRGDAQHFEKERRYRLQKAFNDILFPTNYMGFGASKERIDSANEFMELALSLIRRDAINEGPDMWVADRIEFGIKAAARKASAGEIDEAIEKIKLTVELIEKTMAITDEIILPTSCRFLDGMEWRAEEDWHTPCNDPDLPKERNICIHSEMSGLSTCYCIYPSRQLLALQGKDFEILHEHPEFQKLCNRVKALIVTKEI